MMLARDLSTKGVVTKINAAESSILRNGGNGDVTITVHMKNGLFAGAKVVAASTDRIDANEIRP